MPIALIPSWTIGVAKKDPIASPMPERKSRFMRPLHPRGGTWPGTNRIRRPTLPQCTSRLAWRRRRPRGAGRLTGDRPGPGAARPAAGSLMGLILAAQHEDRAADEEERADRERPDPDRGPDRRDQVGPAEPQEDSTEQEWQHAERDEPGHAVREHREDQAHPRGEERDDIPDRGKAPRREVAAPERSADDDAAVRDPGKHERQHGKDGPDRHEPRPDPGRDRERQLE